jgi:hypothetical protein
MSESGTLPVLTVMLNSGFGWILGAISLSEHHVHIQPGPE